MSLSGGDNVDIMSDMYYKFLVHDCMWSGTCKEDNTHETTNKFSDFSYFSTSPVYGSIFDIFNIDDENSLGELNCDPGYTDTSDQDDSPLNGLSAAEDTEIVDDSNLFTTPCSSASSTSTLTGSTISPAGLLAVTDAHSSSSTSIKLANSRATTSTGKSSGSTIKSTLSSKATKSASSKANSNKSTISVATTAGSSGTSVSSATTSIATSIVTPTISPSAINSVLSNNDDTASPPVTPTIPLSANSPTVNLTAVAAATGTTTSILKNTGKPRNSKSLYPERRKEHNNSEKKRRDHLRNAFNHLRDQIPKLKDGEKKAARVTILKESVSYVTLLKEKHRYLERTKNAETIKHENLLSRLKMLQSSTGAAFIKKNDTIDNDSNLVYVQQCNSSTVC